MLRPWWVDGWCVAAVLHAVDRHPDRPTLGRGDATAGARNPLALLGHRLAPWRGRLDELPADIQAVDRVARLVAVARRADADQTPETPAVTPTPAVGRPPSPARLAAMAAVPRPRLSRAVSSRSRRPEIAVRRSHPLPRHPGAPTMTAPTPRSAVDTATDDRTAAVLARLGEDRPGPLGLAPCASGCDLARAIGVGTTSPAGPARPPTPQRRPTRTPPCPCRASVPETVVWSTRAHDRHRRASALLVV